MSLSRTWTESSVPGSQERRELREKSVAQAVYLHGEPNMVFEREEAVIEVLKTAQTLYNWIVKEEDDD